MADRSRRLPIGAELAPDGRGTSIRVWAPAAGALAVVHAGGETPLAAEAGGYWSGLVPGLAAGGRYQLRVEGGEPIADPASRYQPEGPFGPSVVVSPDAFRWTDAAWRGLPRDRHVLYELHVGTFTPEGTWRAAAAALPFLADVGITTIEMMPVNEFHGPRGWGYDGVNLFAPSHLYGEPDDLRAFVDRAHALGLAVILDVVYNHFGPAGNFVFQLAPPFKSSGKPNDWGEAIAFEHPSVREFFIGNAGYWIDEFHFDGLRLDATQAIVDASSPHVLQEIVQRARAAGAGREILVIGENEPQHAHLVTDFGLDALWNDDFHHTARVAATGVIDGYLHDYGGTPQELMSAITRGFLYQGQTYPWQHAARGQPTRGMAPARFVHFLENHDQVANLGLGARLHTIVDPATLRALTALLLLTPPLPLLFQGQETGSPRPWSFFAKHGDPLDGLVTKGRAEFCAQFQRFATPAIRDSLPVPSADATFTDCILDPAARDLAAPVVQLHRDLLALRRRDAAWTDQRPGACDGAILGEQAFVLRFWQDDPEADRLLLVNLGRTFAPASVPEPRVAPPAGCEWSLVWSSEDVRYGGAGTPDPVTDERFAIPARAALALAPVRKVTR